MAEPTPSRPAVRPLLELAALAQSPLPMWVFDQETLAFLEVNNAAIVEYGYSREEFLKMTILDIRPLEDLPAILHATMHPAEKGPSTRELWRHRKKDGSVFQVEITSQAIGFCGRAGELVLAVAID